MTVCMCDSLLCVPWSKSKKEKAKQRKGEEKRRYALAERFIFAPYPHYPFFRSFLVAMARRGS